MTSFDEMRIAHPELARLGVHRGHAGGQAARVVTPQGVRGTVLRRHERQMHQVAARELCARQQARKGALAMGLVIAAHLENFIERLAGVDHNQRRHQLGDRGDGQRHVRVARIQDRGVRGVEHQGGARAQRRLRERCTAGVLQVRFLHRACGNGGLRERSRE
jgi:hypothetical protein